MGVDFADIDRDGHVDFYVMDMLDRDWQRRKRESMPSMERRSPPGTIEDRPQIPQNVLFHNRGDGTFEEIAAYAGVTATGWSWQPVFLDVDLDGYEDIIIPAGYFRDINDLDITEQVTALRRAGKLVPPKLGPDGKPVERSPQEQKTEVNYQSNRAGRPLEDPDYRFPQPGELEV